MRTRWGHALDTERTQRTMRTGSGDDLDITMHLHRATHQGPAPGRQVQLPRELQRLRGRLRGDVEMLRGKKTIKGEKEPLKGEEQPSPNPTLIGPDNLSVTLMQP